jgi:predicted amidophosphoribosyltransferase
MSVSRSDSRFAWIDETSRRDHWSLERDDHCLFLGEYVPGGRWASGALNSLVLDFKRAPSCIGASPHAATVRHFKELAIATVARALRCAFGKGAVETALTFVPIPTSKRPGDADYCDRLVRALNCAFHGWDADIRPLLRHNATARADHERHAQRLRRAELMRLMELDTAQLTRPLRPIVALFDDVLTSGKHLSAAKARIREQFPDQAVIAVVVARVSRGAEAGASPPEPAGARPTE